MNILENKTGKKIDDVITITKRDGNKKRKYLIMNKLQGKYIPISGKVAFDMFDKLAKEVDTYKGNIIVIGFAETATAIGARIAYDLALNKENHVTYLTTTREVDTSRKPICEFKEEHSHAVEQILYGDIDTFKNADYIIFAEDEVTTGNTICNCVNLLKKEYDLKCHYVVASLMNCMSEEEIARFSCKDITPYWLIKTDKDGFDEIENTDVVVERIKHNIDNPRYGINILTYHERIKELVDTLAEGVEKDNKILVLGTEECSYPSIEVASYLEEKGYNAVTETTTRVPTCIEGVLTNRYSVDSLYGDRNTYLYNLSKYDLAIVITDGSKDGDTLISALVSFGVGKVKMVYIGE